jgi:membrane protein CcdC involved in cytochrome C biogenesis
MDVWTGLLIINFLFGLLAVYYYAVHKGEVFVSDLIGIFFIVAFGSITVWIYSYDVYSPTIHKFLDRMRDVGKKPIWRSKGAIAKEVLYGGNKDE